VSGASSWSFGESDATRIEGILVQLIREANARTALIVDRTVQPDELVAYCRDHLAGFKVPGQIELIDHFPRTASGKIIRDGVRAILEEHDRATQQERHPVRE